MVFVGTEEHKKKIKGTGGMGYRNEYRLKNEKFVDFSENPHKRSIE